MRNSPAKVRGDKVSCTDQIYYQLLKAPNLAVGVLAASEGVQRILVAGNTRQLEQSLHDNFGETRPGTNVFLERALCQLSDYFNGSLRSFSLALDWRQVTSFRRQVLTLLSQTVPYGTTCTYGDLARQLGKVHAARAIGAAMAANPFPIVIPCHRVIGTSNALVGYSGGEGVATKKWLLEFEKNSLAQ